MSTTTSTKAERQGRLWGLRPRGWAESEERQLPTYEAALRRVGVDRGARVLDLGCGAGTFLRLAAERGADVTGLDASPGLIELARERIPSADLRIGELDRLPFEDDAFDLVTGFNSFFFAEDMVGALREAGRVARPGAPVVIQVWGAAERCELLEIIAAVGPLRAEAPSGPGLSALAQPGRLEGLAEAADLRPDESFDHAYAFEFADADALVRAMLGAGGVGEAVEHSGEAAVVDAIRRAAEPHRAANGSIRFENEWHYLIARA